MGTVTDQYEPSDGHNRLIRRLEVIAPLHLGIGGHQGQMVLRDRDVLQGLTQRARATVKFRVPTIDRENLRRAKPGHTATSAAAHCYGRANGLAPVTEPWWHLSCPSSRPILSRSNRPCAPLTTTARFMGSNVLHRGPDVRYLFLSFPERDYPELHTDYHRLYRSKNAPKQYQDWVKQRVQKAEAIAGYGDDHRRRVEAPTEPRRLALPLNANSYPSP